MSRSDDIDPRRRAVLDRVRINAPAVMLKQGLVKDFLKWRVHPEVGIDARALDELTENDLAGMAREFHAAGLTATAHGPFVDMSPGALDPDVLAVVRARFDRALERAALFRPRHVVFHPDYEEWKHGAYRERWLEVSLETWRLLADKARSLGTRLVLENTYERRPGELLPLLEALEKAGVGFCLDTGHASAFGLAPLMDWLDDLAPHLTALHLHDNHGGRDEHLAVGSGRIDFRTLFSRLADLFPQPPAVTLEPHTEADLWPGLDVLADLWPWPLEP